jgi:hypothetical protein
MQQRLKRYEWFKTLKEIGFSDGDAQDAVRNAESLSDAIDWHCNQADVKRDDHRDRSTCASSLSGRGRPHAVATARSRSYSPASDN